MRQRNLEFVRSLGRPAVLLQETLEIADEDIAVINQDDYSGGHMVAAHVLSKGAKRLLMLTPSMEWPAIDERRRGMEVAVAEGGKNCSLQILGLS